MNVDIAIITIREDEFEALLQRFKPTPYREPGKRGYGICRIETKDEQNYRVAIARCSEQGNDTSQKLANDIIHDLDPQLILVVGIAGGVPHDEFTLGDVIISTRIHNLNVGAQHADGSSTFDIRGGIHPRVSDITGNLLLYKNLLAGWNEPDSIGQKRPEMDPQQAIISGNDDWRKKVQASIDLHFGIEQNRTRPPKFKTGSIASSNYLIRNPLVLKQWREMARAILAVEMETAGVYEAAQGIHHQYPVMTIRGISDIIGLERDARWTAYACQAAAAFAYAFIMTSPIDPRIGPVGSRMPAVVSEPQSDGSSRPGPFVNHSSEHHTKAVKLFYSYSHRDEKLRHQLETHLGLLRRQGEIDDWHDRKISAGTEWAGEIDSHIDSAQIILLLVSATFLASDYCYDREMHRAIQRHETGEARVIPIILRPVDWQSAPFGKLQPLPRDGKPVTSWRNTDEAWTVITKGIREVIETIRAQQLKKHSISEYVDTSPPYRADLLNTSLAQFHAHRADTLYYSGHYEEALKAYEQALQHDSHYALAHYRRGETLCKLGDYSSALVAFADARRFDPENPDIYRNMGVVLEKLGRYDEALDAYKRVLRLDAADYVSKGNILYKLGSYEDALNAYESALSIDPNYAAAYYNKGNVLSRLGKSKEAQRAYKKARELDNH